MFKAKHRLLVILSATQQPKCPAQAAIRCESDHDFNMASASDGGGWLFSCCRSI